MMTTFLTSIRLLSSFSTSKSKKALFVHYETAKVNRIKDLDNQTKLPG